MNNTLIDNSTEQLSMQKTLNDCLSQEGLQTVCIATGYWDMPGLALVVEGLEAFLKKEGTKLRLLIGKDPYVFANQLKKPKVKSPLFPDDYIMTDINDLELKDEYMHAISCLLDYCTPDDGSKVEIRVYRTNANEDAQFLHSKCYIFVGDNNAIGIVGSSNFTQKGLNGNAELNYMETDWMRVAVPETGNPNQKSHVMWFEEKWQQSQPWNKTFIEQILRPSPIGKNVEKEKNNQPLTPYELYIKLLHYQFGDMIDVNKTQVISSYLPKEFSSLEYQLDAVKQCFSIMKTHGGFMLADVVGLGKTIVGTLIIKYFLNYPDADREHKVLVITPPAIKSAWKDTIMEFDKDSNDQIEPFVDYITTGSIDSLIDDEDGYIDTGDFETVLTYSNYGLIIIDESHKFRNSDTAMYEALDNLIAQIGANTGNYPYIGLLSATPQNNTPNDLKNQIYLFERNHQYCTLDKVEGRNLEAYFSAIMTEYNALRKEMNFIAAKPEKTPEDIKRLEEINEGFKRISASIRDTILCDLLVRRTRTDIKEFYKDDMEKQGLVFPEISGPHSLKYKMDDELAQLFADTMDIIAPTADVKAKGIDYLQYYRYRAIQYLLKDSDKDKYKGRGSRGAGDIAEQLAKIMQTLLVKRLESSFSAFRESLKNLRVYTENMIRMWENNTIFICPQIDVNAELNVEDKTKKLGKKVTFDDCLEDIRKKIENLTKKGKNEKEQNKEYTQNDFNAEYIKLIKKDHELITKLYDRWARNSEDPKLDEFKESLKPILFNPETNRPQKLVIFSEAIDTVTALKRAVERKGYKALVITANNRDKMEQTIRENFDANYKGDWKQEYQVIITTEVLAEGINLHRANVILNYDTPWNSTRLMQRIGRVNRIGSSEPYVYVYNFMPSAEGDRQIQLVEKAHIKLQSFHTLFGEDAKVFTEDETIAHYKLKQFVDGEESPFEKYIYELKQFRDQHPERYNFIVQNEDDLQMAVTNREGNSYLVVRTPKTKGLYVQVDKDGKGKIIRALDMFPAFCSDTFTVRQPLPEDWKNIQQTAIRTVGQHLAKMNSYKVKDKAATKAKEIIIKLSDNNSISATSQALLDAAFAMIKKGNADIIRTVIVIGKEVFGESDSLFQLEQADIDEIIARKLDKIVDEQAKQTGKPEVYMALAK